MSGPSTVPALRVRTLNDAPARPDAAYVLYWMIAYRRARFNFSLQHARDLARAWKKPLVVLEALRCDYPWASDRLHQFVLEGMADNRSAFARTPVLYYPYVEPSRGAGEGLLETLAQEACAVVTDDFPCFFLPHMVDAAARRLRVRLDQVDSNGILPLRASGIAFPSAYAFRRFVQKHARPQLETMPEADPLKHARLPRLRRLPGTIAERWPAASASTLRGGASGLRRLPIDHSVPTVLRKGGQAAAGAAWRTFLRSRLAKYSDARNEPEQNGTSGLSPYLHFGHISVHEVFAGLAKAQRWTTRKLKEGHAGKREGWWRMSEPAEAFLDQIVVWRELGFNMCTHRQDYDRYESLPAWAQQTLEKHAADRRPVVYDLRLLEEGRTHDPLWNAAQGQLVSEGWYHNYMRMLWGKKILEWSAHPRDALQAMIELMNRYSLDGRDPNSYSGYFWTLGRYDRPWPERPIFGTIRYMSSQNTARKFKVKNYIRQFAPLSK